MSVQVIVEDHVVPQLFTSAIEAYEVMHRGSVHAKAKNKLETFGLLWGYALPARGGLPERLVAVMATIETSALRHSDWVRPDSDSIKMKRDFIRDYWPHLELIGTFHTHPYENLQEVKSLQGWRASGISGEEGDWQYWPDFHRRYCEDMPTLAHMVIAICGLEKKGSAWPQRLEGKESHAGYVLSADYRKLWIRAYVSEKFEEVGPEEIFYEMTEDVLLNISSLEQRFR